MNRKKLLLPSLLAVASIFPTLSANADTLNKSLIALEDTPKPQATTTALCSTQRMPPSLVR